MRNLYLAAILLSSTLLAEELTTENLITNGTFDNGTTGWTLTGNAVRIGDCCPGGHDLEFGDSGSIEQAFGLTSNNISQPMLDNGITLNSSVEVQNGECGVAQCWGGQGNADSFTIRLQIRDSNNEILATTSQTRTNITGINGKDFTDSLTYTGIGSNIGNILITGSDANSPAYLGGPNVDNILVTMTYDNTVLTTTQTEELQEIEEIISFIETEPIEFTELFEEVTVQEFVEEEYSFEILTEMVELNEEEKFVEESLVLEIYEEPETEQEVATEIEREETVVAEEQTGTEEVSEREEGNSVEEQPTNFNETSKEIVAEQTERDDTTGNSTSSVSEEEVVDERTPTENVRVNIKDISEQIAKTNLSIDQQLVLTQKIIAKAMSDTTKITGYTQKNLDIFKQPNIIDTNIDSYMNNIYVDSREIYPNQYYEDKLWTSRQ
tara:strand:- start:8274 stop:9587 length:1314 start_codon:yes stop_codon:yes gene_type:complete